MSLDSSRVAWRKSSYSANSVSCIETGNYAPEIVLIRDSRNPEGVVLFVSADNWRAFVSGVQVGPVLHSD